MNNLWYILPLIILILTVRIFKRKEGKYILKYKEGGNEVYEFIEGYQIKPGRIEYTDQNGQIKSIPVENLIGIKTRQK